MYLLIRHEPNEERKARRDEVAEAKARNIQRDAQLRQTSEEPSHTTITLSHTTGTLSHTHAKARAKDRTQVGNTLANGYMRTSGAIGISLRKHGKARGLLCQSTPCECACAKEKKRSRMRQQRTPHAARPARCCKYKLFAHSQTRKKSDVRYASRRMQRTLHKYPPLV
jgi:hypothetical protein